MKNVLLATTASLALFALAACSQEESTDPAPAPDEQSQVNPAPQNTEETAQANDGPVVDDVAQAVGETLQPVAEAAQELTQGLTEELSNAAEPAGELVAQIADNVDNAVGDAAVAISDTLATQGENASAMVGQVVDQVASIARTDDPLTTNSWGYVGTDAVVVTFSDGSVSGNAGCNAFTGSYTDDGSGNIEVGPLVSTKMLCEEAIMTIEREIMTGIGAAVSYTIEDTSLVLTDLDGNALTLEAQLLN